jgi:hypothetical protein
MKVPLCTLPFVLFLALAVPAQSISGSIENGTVRKGASSKGVVILNIPSGLHVNSNRPDSEFAVPTTVRFLSPGVQARVVSYPRGKRKKFAFSETPISVYEGRVLFPFRVNVPAGFRGSRVRLKAVVKFQACTEEVCYAPKSQQIIISARVRK